MNEHRRLSHLCLFQLLGCSMKFNVGNPEAQDVVGAFKKIFCNWIRIVNILSHSNMLGSLTGKYISCHTSVDLGYSSDAKNNEKLIGQTRELLIRLLFRKKQASFNKSCLQFRRWNHALILLSENSIPVSCHDIIHGIPKKSWEYFESTQEAPKTSEISQYSKN